MLSNIDMNRSSSGARFSSLQLMRLQSVTGGGMASSSSGSFKLNESTTITTPPMFQQIPRLVSPDTPSFPMGGASGGSFAGGLSAPMGGGVANPLRVAAMQCQTVAVSLQERITRHGVGLIEAIKNGDLDTAGGREDLMADAVEDWKGRVAELRTVANKTVQLIGQLVNDMAKAEDQRRQDEHGLQSRIDFQQRTIEQLQARLKQTEQNNAAERVTGAVRTFLKRTREVAPLGEVTILFTDVYQAAQLWKKIPHTMTQSMVIHHHILKDALPKFKGYLARIDGDTFMLAFPDPFLCLQYCCAVQSRLMEEYWPAELLRQDACKEERADDGDGPLLFRGLRLLMAFDTGEPDHKIDPITKRVEYITTSRFMSYTNDMCDVITGGELAIGLRAFTALSRLPEFRELASAHRMDQLAVPDDENTMIPVHVFLPKALEARKTALASATYERMIQKLRYATEAPTNTASMRALTSRGMNFAVRDVQRLQQRLYQLEEQLCTLEADNEQLRLFNETLESELEAATEAQDNTPLPSRRSSRRPSSAATYPNRGLFRSYSHDDLTVADQQQFKPWNNRKTRESVRFYRVLKFKDALIEELKRELKLVKQQKAALLENLQKQLLAGIILSRSDSDVSLEICRAEIAELKQRVKFLEDHVADQVKQLDTLTESSQTKERDMKSTISKLKAQLVKRDRPFGSPFLGSGSGGLRVATSSDALDEASGSLHRTRSSRLPSPKGSGPRSSRRPMPSPKSGGKDAPIKRSLSFPDLSTAHNESPPGGAAAKGPAEVPGQPSPIQPTSILDALTATTTPDPKGKTPREAAPSPEIKQEDANAEPVAGLDSTFGSMETCFSSPSGKPRPKKQYQLPPGRSRSQAGIALKRGSTTTASPPASPNAQKELHLEGVKVVAEVEEVAGETAQQGDREKTGQCEDAAKVKDSSAPDAAAKDNPAAGKEEKEGGKTSETEEKKPPEPEKALVVPATSLDDAVRKATPADIRVKKAGMKRPASAPVGGKPKTPVKEVATNDELVTSSLSPTRVLLDATAVLPFVERTLLIEESLLNSLIEKNHKPPTDPSRKRRLSGHPQNLTSQSGLFATEKATSRAEKNPRKRKDHPFFWQSALSIQPDSKTISQCFHDWTPLPSNPPHTHPKQAAYVAAVGAEKDKKGGHDPNHSVMLARRVSFRTYVQNLRKTQQTEAASAPHASVQSSAPSEAKKS